MPILTLVNVRCVHYCGEFSATNEMNAEKEKQTFFAQQERLWRTRCHERSECGEREDAQHECGPQNTYVKMKEVASN